MSRSSGNGWLAYGCAACSLSARRDALRFLKAIDAEKFADGLRQALSDDEISMAFWLSTGFPPQLRLKDLRARDRGQLRLDLGRWRVGGSDRFPTWKCDVSNMFACQYWENFLLPMGYNYSYHPLLSTLTKSFHWNDGFD